MRSSTLNILGVVILFLGLGSVVLIERNVRIEEETRVEDTEETHALLYPQDYASYARGTEMIGGKMTALMIQWQRELAELGHSRPFAIGIALLSMGAAAGFFAKSHLSPRR